MPAELVGLTSNDLQSLANGTMRRVIGHLEGGGGGGGRNHLN